jgi:two-component system chemotaxis response regulator CheB
MNKIKILIVDDSVLVRKVLTEILSAVPMFEVVGTAIDPIIARDKIKQLQPDVLTLDIEMPRMDGVTFLRNLMRLRPMPVVMISTLTEKGAPITLEALEIGAVDFIAKPKTDVTSGLENYAKEIIEKVRMAAKANVRSMVPLPPPSPVHKKITSYKNGQIIAIGASTGGTEAIREVLSTLPANCPPIVIAQHIPPVFSTSFAARMNACSEPTVYEAQDGQRIEQGCVYIAPGDAHLKVKGTRGNYRCVLDHGAVVNRHKPSVEVLFDSMITSAGDKAIGVMLTGMGADGAQGMLRMKEAGIYNIVQDESSAVVWGMPGAAFNLNAHSIILPLTKITQHMLSKIK